MTGLDIGGWSVAAFAVAGGVNQILRIVDRVKERPAPSETYTTLANCDRRHHTISTELVGLRSDLQALRMEIRSDLKESIAANELRASKIHSRIDDLLEAVSELRGKVSK